MERCAALRCWRRLSDGRSARRGRARTGTMQQTGERWAVGGGRQRVRCRRLGGLADSDKAGERGRAWGAFSTWRRPDVHLSIPPPGQPYPARRLAHTEAGKSERSMFIEPIRPGPASVPKNRKNRYFHQALSSPPIHSQRPGHFTHLRWQQEGARRPTTQHKPSHSTLHQCITPSKHQTTVIQHNFHSLKGGSAKHRASITGVPAYHKGC